jgi:hypothetical protein
MANGHARVAPSKLTQRLACIGSLAMEEGMQDTSSEAADEGTAAHFLAATCLNSNQDPAAWVKGWIGVTPEGRAYFRAGNVDVKDRYFEVDPEMVAAVRKYVQFVEHAAKGGDLYVEQPLPIDHLTGEDGATGTGDAIILAPRILKVVDLKYGAGNEVFALDNDQLLSYGSGALRKFGMLDDFEELHLTIHQPRIKSEPDTWVLTVAQLREWEAKVQAITPSIWLAYEHRANWINEKREAALSYLTVGDHCRYCLAKAKPCPKYDAFVLEAIGVEDFADVRHDEVSAIPEEPTELAAKMAACSLIEVWIKAVRAKVEAELFAGKEVPGYKVVRGKQGNRAWKDAAAAEVMLKSFRLKQEQMYDFSLISPTTAEKLFEAETIGKKQYPKLLPLIVRAEGKASVAPASDKRPAIALGATVEDFDVKTPSAEDLL